MICPFQGRSAGINQLHIGRCRQVFQCSIYQASVNTSVAVVTMRSLSLITILLFVGMATAVSHGANNERYTSTTGNVTSTPDRRPGPKPRPKSKPKPQSTADSTTTTTGTILIPSSNHGDSSTPPPEAESSPPPNFLCSSGQDSGSMDVQCAMEGNSSNATTPEVEAVASRVPQPNFASVQQPGASLLVFFCHLLDVSKLLGYNNCAQ